MHGMFYGCSALKYLDIHSFDITSAVVWDICFIIANL